MSEIAYLVLVAIILTVLWVPSHILSPTPCTPLIMLFSPNRNSLLGVAGLVILVTFLVLIGISIIVILRKSSDGKRDSTQLVYNIHSDPVVLEEQQDFALLVQKRLAENTSAYYGIGLSCLYVRNLI